MKDRYVPRVSRSAPPFLVPKGVVFILLILLIRSTGVTSGGGGGVTPPLPAQCDRGPRDEEEGGGGDVPPHNQCVRT